MFSGQYPPFTLNSNGAVLVTTTGTPNQTSGQYPPFTLSGGYLLIKITS